MVGQIWATGHNLSTLDNELLKAGNACYSTVPTIVHGTEQVLDTPGTKEWC